jgi:hypothetical protein
VCTEEAQLRGHDRRVVEHELPSTPFVAHPAQCDLLLELVVQVVLEVPPECHVEDHIAPFAVDGRDELVCSLRVTCCAYLTSLYESCDVGYLNLKDKTLARQPALRRLHTFIRRTLFLPVSTSLKNVPCAQIRAAFQCIILVREILRREKIDFSIHTYTYSEHDSPTHTSPQSQ